jgi:hypothetical protein
MISKNPWADKVVQAAECLPSKWEVLSSNLYTTHTHKKKKEKKERKGRDREKRKKKNLISKNPRIVVTKGECSWAEEKHVQEVDSYFCLPPKASELYM